jgi:hypothetical protein
VVAAASPTSLAQGGDLALRAEVGVGCLSSTGYSVELNPDPLVLNPILPWGRHSQRCSRPTGLSAALPADRLLLSSRHPGNARRSDGLHTPTTSARPPGGGAPPMGPAPWRLLGDRQGAAAAGIQSWSWYRKRHPADHLVVRRTSITSLCHLAPDLAGLFRPYDTSPFPVCGTSGPVPVGTSSAQAGTFTAFANTGAGCRAFHRAFPGKPSTSYRRAGRQLQGGRHVARGVHEPSSTSTPTRRSWQRHGRRQSRPGRRVHWSSPGGSRNQARLSDQGWRGLRRRPGRTARRRASPGPVPADLAPGTHAVIVTIKDAANVSLSAPPMSFSVPARPA